MNQIQCTNCFQSYEDCRSPPDLSLHRSVSYYQCPNCWAKTLAWDDGLDAAEQKVYLPEKRALISDWNKRWAILTDLLIQIFTSPEPPGESLELQYLSLHFWFIEHQYEFLQVFADLYEGQAVVTDAYTNSEDSPDNTESAEIEEHHWNPYQWYYREMDLQRGTRKPPYD